MSAFRILVAAACVAVALGGCTGLTGRLERAAHSDAAHAGSLLAKTQNGNAVDRDNDGVIVKNSLWLSGNTVKLPVVQTLPPLFGEPASFDGTVDSLQAFAERVTRLTRIPARVAPGAQDAAARATAAPNMSAAAGGGTGTPGLPPLPTGLLQGTAPFAGTLRAAAGGSPVDVGVSAPVHLVYPRGTLRGLLDMGAARFGVYWKYDAGTIVFFYTDTRVFQVTSIPGDSRLDTYVMSGASSNGNGSGSSGGATNGGAGGGGGSIGSGGSGNGGSTPSVSSDNSTNIGMTAQLSVYNGLQAAIKAMLSPSGSVLASPATGSITVTDTPDVLERVGEFMAQQNRVLSRQVLVNITVLSVTLSADDTYGINWNAVYQALGTRFGITNTFSSLVSTATPNEFSATVITPSSRASGTTAMIAALSQQGTVHRKTSASVTTLNDQPVPVQVAEQQGYLAQISTTSTLNVGTQTSLMPGTVTTGFNMTLLPHILDDGTVMLQFYTNLSSLAKLENFNANGQTIQLPTVDTRNFLQRVAIKSGQTLVISGYEGTSDQTNRQGVGTPDNYAFGGGQSATHSREIIVILLTPVAMNGA
ncbi:type IVB pilus formation R64 PilN family outer membrane protein [Paraburkholderia sp. WSM4175]|uniref:PilN family type IVB pilus formation outer membrane protein n=1 Tax=Paraburkholderia sp. WSM4175 TaxID=2991072 RepID=UPI003D1E10AE